MDSQLILPYILIALGFLLMGAELVLPSGGISFVLGVGSIVVGVAMIFASNATHGLVTLTGVSLVLLIVGPVLVHLWPRTAVGKSFVLSAAAEDDTVANMPVNLELENLRGRYGKTLSSLRPAGLTQFDGRRIDTLSEGPMIEPGTWVRCINVKAGRVIVRQVERPPDLADMDTSDLRG